MMPRAPTASEVWFDAYLESHGYRFEVEPDLGVPKRPDRLIERDGLRAVCEVKQFDKDPRADKPRGVAFVMSEEEVHKPVRRAVKAASDQLRPLKSCGLPLVILLANPNDFRVSLGTEDVIHALYGDSSVTFPIYLGTGPTPPSVREDAQFIAGRNGQIRNVAQYVSAVVLLRHRLNEEDFFAQREHEFIVDYKARNPGEVDLTRMLAEGLAAAKAIPEDEIPSGEYWRVDVIRTVSDEAVPLLDALFTGPCDTLWNYDREREVMERVR